MSAEPHSAATARDAAGANPNLELVESVVVAWRALDLAGKQPTLVRDGAAVPRVACDSRLHTL